nr:MAG TPA: hypothetical protein [Caudoviricetes sp.]
MIIDNLLLYGTVLNYKKLILSDTLIFCMDIFKSFPLIFRYDEKRCRNTSSLIFLCVKSLQYSLGPSGLLTL